MANKQGGIEDNGATGEQAGRSAQDRVEPTLSMRELFRPVQDLTPEEEAILARRWRRDNPVYDARTGGTAFTGFDVINHPGGHQTEYRGQVGRTMIQTSEDPRQNAIFAYESMLQNPGSIVTTTPAGSLLNTIAATPESVRRDIAERVTRETRNMDRPDYGEHSQQTRQQSRREHAHDHRTAGLGYSNGTVRNARNSGSNNRNRGNTGRGRAHGQGRRGRGSWNGRWNQNNRNTNRRPAWNSGNRNEARSRGAQREGRGREGHGWRRAHQHQHGSQDMAHSHGVQQRQTAHEDRGDIAVGDMTIKEESPEVEFPEIEIEPDLHIKREPEW